MKPGWHMADGESIPERETRIWKGDRSWIPRTLEVEEVCELVDYKNSK